MFLGLRSVIYPAPDLAASKAWFTRVLGREPYFDEPFYVGFSVGGFELGLDPNSPVERGPLTYWGVPDAQAAYDALLEAGATSNDDPVHEVGDGIRMGTVREAGGSILGVIENPVFALVAVTSPGPGL